MWASLYNENNQPTYEDIKTFISSELWSELCSYIENKYKVLPKLEYSKCSAQKGWNVKYKKRGKSICTLYPMKDHFIALIVIGAKEKSETELMIQSCTTYVQDLYKKTPFSCGGQWLMIKVDNKSVLEDVHKLIQVRVGV